MSSSDDFFDELITTTFSFIGLAAVLGMIVAIIVSVYYALPLIALGFGGWMYYKWQFHSPAGRERQAKQHTDELYRAARTHLVDLPENDTFCAPIHRKVAQFMPEAVAESCMTAAAILYDAEKFDGDIPPPPAICNSMEGARYRDFLSAHAAKLTNPISTRLAQETLITSFSGLLQYLPDIEDADDAFFTMPLRYCLGDHIGKALEAIIFPLYSDDVMQLGLFSELRQQLLINLHVLSGIPYTAENMQHPDLVMPRDYNGEDIVFDYLRDTPLYDIFLADIPFAIPTKTRAEHAWAIAPQGTGKTQLIQYLVSRDLDKVSAGEASIVVMDSQGDLINQISSLKCFAPGERLYGKLIIIRPDIAYPPALNLFDLGKERINAYSEHEREKFTTAAIDQLTYMMEAVMGGGGTLTPKQTNLFRHIIRLLMVLPSGTLETFSTLLTVRNKEELAPYLPYIAKLHKPSQDFFNTSFISGEYKDTMGQVGWRISSLRENPYFERMFSHPRSKLDLFTELNSSKVILVHTDQEHLGTDGTNIFGRFFIGSLLTASQERASLERSHRKPVYTYIDECQDYIANDSKIAVLLDQARKMNICLFLAHQRTRQIKDMNVLDALTNTAIKFASTDNVHDAPIVAKAMKITPEFISTQRERHFALSARRITPAAVSFKVPFFVMEHMEKMSSYEAYQVQEELRDTYCAPEEMHSTASDEAANAANEPESQAEDSDSETAVTSSTPAVQPDDLDNPDIKPGDSW